MTTTSAEGASALGINTSSRRVVITGLGTINPLGNTVNEYMDNLVAGTSGIRLAKKTDLSSFHVRIAGEVDLPDLTEYFRSKRMARRLDDYVIFSHIAGTQAVQDSGLEIERAPHRYGALIGTGDAGIKTHMVNINRISKTGMQSTSPFYVIGAIPNTGSAFFAQEWNLQGPSFAVSSACATGNHAIGVAAMLIQSGMADAMFTGGAEAAVNEAGMAAFGNIMALSDRNDDPVTASRPFDKDRNGFVLSEGAGVICLEELEHAKARGAQIYAELTGFYFTTDAHDLVAPHPEGRNSSKAIRGALDSAKLNPEDIGLINSHGTSTPLGDRVEGTAVNIAMGDRGTTVPVHSTKSMVGHMLGGASAVEAIAAVMVFQRGVIHPSINLFEQDPEINLNIITEPQEDAGVRHILSNAFGFGGHNACIVLSRFDG
jgi:3-oxoacyl-[acyl-carrier-protein] synthase II